LFFVVCYICYQSNIYFLFRQALQQRNDFSDDDINNFQQKADTFFKAWLRLTGYDGITNYVHMIGAGHLRYFLRKWRNLNRLSNQGWESYNALVTAYWHHRTMKGGGKGEDRSKILAIARWLSRDYVAQRGG
jgi:hypothetical protein